MDGQRQNYIPLPIPSAGDKKYQKGTFNVITCILAQTFMFSL
jgi:hypothetical protein